MTKFNDKIILCNSEDLVKTIKEVELEWVVALLQRLKVDQGLLDKILTGHRDFGKSQWRDYLIVEKGLNVLKYQDFTIVEKLVENKGPVLLGKWERPEVIRVKDGGKQYCELHLKYWQLI